MSEIEVNLLCTGDLHLGRYPTKIPDRYGLRRYSPTAIWSAIVEKAIELDVDGVLITGDIVDRANRYYEAYGSFEAGVKRLIGEEIEVFVVSGNHDYDLLPSLVKAIDSEYFTLLGSGGNWEAKTLYKEGEPLLNLLGWSYPSRHVYQDPTLDLKIRDRDLPMIGLLHCEMDNPSSSYAPVSKDRLKEIGVDGWVLGHIHRSSLDSKGETFILNPGSPQPLSPKDKGCHSIWQLKLSSNKDFEISPLTFIKFKVYRY